MSDEPKVIALLRRHENGRDRMYNLDEQTQCDASDILVAYDAIRAERDAAVRERENVSSQLWDCMNEREALRARLEEAELDAKRYDYLRALLRHAKWNDIDTLHELKPEHEKFIADASLDSALDAQITYSRAALATPTTTEDA